jgi:hypothetical protein
MTEKTTRKVEIDKSIPIPRKGCGKKPRWPVEEMEVGDSFAVLKSEYNSATISAYHYGKRAGKVFAVRKMYEDNEIYARIWRTE